MKANRRAFLRKAALGSAAISYGMGLSILKAGNSPGISGLKQRSGTGISSIDQVFSGWEVSFDEQSATLSIKNGRRDCFRH